MASVMWCAYTWWVRPPDEPTVAAIDLRASARGDHVACFSLGHNGSLIVGGDLAGSPHETSWKGSSAFAPTLPRPIAILLVWRF